MWGSTVAFITKHCELLQCFQHNFFFLFLVFVLFFFLKLSISIFFKILSWLRFSFAIFFLKHCELLQCFSMWFFLWFFPNLSCRFFFNIELVQNYNYNKVKSYKESVVVFLTKYCGLLQYLSEWFFILFYWEKRYSFPHRTLSIATTFFLMCFSHSKIIFVDFFLILSW